jgi:hypothetical protein
MKQPTVITVALGYLFVTLTCTVYSTSVLANSTNDCRQEALDYDIPAEGLDDYINGCLASRGELPADDSNSMESVPPDETDDFQDTLTGDTDAAQ